MILEKGHTMMEVDSVLEHYFKPPIFAPTDYYTRMRLARPDHPYHLNIVNHTFFKNYDKACTFSSIRPGKKAGDPTVTDIRQHHCHRLMIYGHHHIKMVIRHQLRVRPHLRNPWLQLKKEHRESEKYVMGTNDVE